MPEAQFFSLWFDLLWLGTRSAFRPHEIKGLSSALPFEFQSDLELSTRGLRKWRELFPSSGDITGFTYNWPHSIRAYLRGFEKLGMRLSSLRMLGQDLVFFDNAKIGPGRYKCTTQIRDIFQRKNGQLIVSVETTMVDKMNNPVLRATVYGVIWGAQQIPGEPSLQPLGPKLEQRFAALREREPQIGENFGLRQIIRAGPYAGIRFSLLSGDPTFIHTHRAFSRIFGFRDAFMQGCWVTNTAVSTMGERARQGLSITLCRPFLLDKEYEFLQKDGRYEIVAAGRERTLIAFGESLTP